MFELLGSCKAFLALLLIIAAHSVSRSNATTTNLASQVDDGPPPAFTGGCLNVSLTAPIWTIEAFTYEDSDEASTVTLSITSNTIQKKLNCSGQTPGHRHLVAGNCHGDEGEDDYSPQFNFDTSAGDLYIDHTWVCDDNAARIPVTFVGTGIGRLPLHCDSGKCMTTGSVRILARLLKPIEVSPYIPPAPTGHDVPGCTARSGSPSWKISDLDWRTGGLNQTWTPVLFPQWYIRGAGMVRFNITNEANQQKYTCAWMSRYSETSNVTLEHSFTSPFLTDLTGVWFSCNVHSLYQDGNLTHNYETETSARLISAERRILINQTWYCDDEGSASPIQFHALGAIELPGLKCRDRPVIEPDSETLPFTDDAGEPVINGSACVAPDFDIQGVVESRYPMEPYALELPNPTASRCTVHSFNPDEQYFVLATDAVTPRWWYFQNNTLYHDDEGKPAAGLVFAIRSLLNNKYLNCQGWSSKLNPNQTYYDPDYWFDCVVDESIPNMRNWKANYNAKTSILSVGVTWGCDELSPGNSVIFTAFAHGDMGKPACEDSPEGNGSNRTMTDCYFPMATSDLRFPFTNISWIEPYGI